MTDDTKSDTRVLAAGTEKVLPRARAPNADSGEVSREKERPGAFRRFAVLLPLVATICCGGPTERQDEDADAGGDVAADIDSDGGQEEDAEADGGPETDVGDIADDGETLDDSGEVEASCPTTTSVSEEVEAPGPIGEMEQTITETYEVVRECDGTIARGGLLELGIELSSPASPEQLQGAVEVGSDTNIFGERVKLTAIGIDGLGYGKPVPGAERMVRLMGSVDDGVYHVSVTDFRERARLRIVEIATGTFLGDPAVEPGGYAALPSGRVVMVTNLRYDPIDPLGSMCQLSILEAPVNVPNGETVGHGDGTFRLGTASDSGNLTGLRLVRE